MEHVVRLYQVNRRYIAAEVLAGMIEAGSVLGAAGLNWASQSNTNRSNRRLAGEQNSANVQLWNAQNLYNDPSAQMARLKAAGINPSLIYGQGGIENLAGAPPQMDRSMDRAAMVDPMMIAQLRNMQAQTELTKAQAKATEDENNRQNELQGGTIKQMAEDLAKTQNEVKLLQEQIDGQSLDNQRKAYDYLNASLDYQFKQATFKDSVKSFHTALLGSELKNRIDKFNLDKAMQQLAYEVVGWDLSNRQARASLNLSLQEYRQNESLFDFVHTKYYWDAQSAHATTFNLRADTELKKSEKTLRDLSFWIDMRDNPRAANLYRANLNGYNSYINEFFDSVIRNSADDWKHGFDLPLRIGFNIRSR